jgi:hypothetical protein
VTGASLLASIRLLLFGGLTGAENFETDKIVGSVVQNLWFLPATASCFEDRFGNHRTA